MLNQCTGVEQSPVYPLRQKTDPCNDGVSVSPKTMVLCFSFHCSPSVAVETIFHEDEEMSSLFLVQTNFDMERGYLAYRCQGFSKTLDAPNADGRR